MAEKAVGIRQQVKKGTLTSENALSKIMSAEFRNPSIVGWLQSRIRRGVKVEPPKAQEPPPQKTPEPAPTKSPERRRKVQRRK